MRRQRRIDAAISSNIEVSLHAEALSKFQTTLLNCQRQESSIPYWHFCGDTGG